MGNWKESFPIRFSKFILVVSLGIVAALQVYTLLSGYGKLWISRALRTYRLTSMERNTLFYVGSSGGKFMDFISATVPADGAVVVTPNIVVFSQQSLLQFFLMPRSVPHCGCDEKPEHYSTRCIECLRTTEYYVPAIGDFPAPEVMQGWKTFIPHSVDSYLYHGIYAPLQAESTQSATRVEEPLPLLAALAIDIVVCGLVFLLGYWIADGIMRTRERIHAIVAGIPIGMGSLTWGTFLASWVGFPVTIFTFAAIYVIIISIIWIVKKRRSPTEKRSPANASIRSMIPKQLGKRPLFLGLLLLTLLVSALFVTISIVRSYSTTDGIANWAIKGHAIALEGTVYAGRNWGAHSLAYPQNIPIMIALFRLVDGDVLPGSKMMYALIGVSLLLGCYKAWRRRKVHDTIAVLGLLSFFSIHLVFTQATIGWGNFVYTVYIVLGTIYFIEGIADRTPGCQFLGGTLLAYAAWTRPEGVGLSAALALGVIITIWVKRRQVSLQKWLIFVSFIPASYLVFSSAAMRSDEIGSVLDSFLRSVTSGAFDLKPLSLLPRYAIDRFLSVANWGYTVYLIAALIAFIVLFRRRRMNLDDSSLVVVVIIAILFPFAMFFVAYSDKISYYTRFLAQSFDRAMMPAVILLFFALIALSARANADEEPAHE